MLNISKRSIYSHHTTSIQCRLIEKKNPIPFRHKQFPMEVQYLNFTSSIAYNVQSTFRCTIAICCVYKLNTHRVEFSPFFREINELTTQYSSDNNTAQTNTHTHKTNERMCRRQSINIKRISLTISIKSVRFYPVNSL